MTDPRGRSSRLASRPLDSAAAAARSPAVLSESMRDLTAQVTSDLLQFPEVTIQALGEDEITLESVLRGKFAAGNSY